MSLGGGGGTSSAGSSKAYIPQQQPAADQGYQNLTSSFYNLGQTGLDAFGGVPPAAAAYPFVKGTTQNVLTNPYQGQAVQGGVDANNYFTGGVLPNVTQGSQGLAGLANLATGAGPGALATASNPAYAAAQGAGNNMTGGFQGAAGQALGDIFNPQYQAAISAGNTGANKLFGDAFNPNYINAITQGNLASNRQFGAGAVNRSAGDAIRTAAFDPQNALYNRTYNRVADQVGAGNANSGLAGTPYGESVRGNTLSNFNLDWQNNLLNRMVTGGTAAGGLDTAASGLDTAGINQMLQPAQATTQAGISDIGAGINAMLNPATSATSAAATDIGAASQAGQSALSSLLTPANAQVVAALQGSQALQGLAGVANTGFGGADKLLEGAASGINTFAGLPQSNYNTTQGNNFSALGQEINLGNAGFGPANQTINDLQSYLNLGQSASQNANNIGSTNFNQLTQAAGGLGQLAGLAGSGGSGGIGSLIGSSGGLPAEGDFFGGGALTSAEQGVTGGSGILGALAPLGFSA